jgi:transposase
MKRTQYDEAFKAEAVKLALSGELSYAEVARDLGVNYKTLSNWIYDIRHHEPRQIRQAIAMV